MPVKIRQELFFGRLQQGSDDVSAFQRHAADPPAAGAAQKPVQHLLGLVIGRMTDRNQPCALLSGTGTQACITQIPGRVLKAQAMLTHIRPRIYLKCKKRHRKRPGQPKNSCRFFCGIIRSQAMIYMGADKGTGQNRPQTGQDMQECC